MDWYVSSNGETSGPHNEAMVREWVESGRIGPDAFLRDEAAAAWVPLAQTPFGARPASPARATPSGGGEALGTLMILLPFVSALLVIFWVGEMNMFQKPGHTLLVLGLGTVIGTAILASVEAASLGMGSHPDARGKQGNGPITWFIAICVFWIVGFPWYLHQRKHYGKRSLAFGGVVIALFFLGSWAVMNNAIEAKRAQIIRAFR